MDKHIEGVFVRAFFDKTFADRLYYELTAESKRGRFFDKIAHNADRYLKHSTVIRRSIAPLPVSDISKHLMCSKGQCYVIAYRHEFDGCFVDIDDTIQKLHSCGSPYVMFNAEKCTAYIETEYDFSVHESYLLQADNGER